MNYTDIPYEARLVLATNFVIGIVFSCVRLSFKLERENWFSAAFQGFFVGFLYLPMVVIFINLCLLVIRFIAGDL